MSDPDDDKGGRLKGWSRRKLDANRLSPIPEVTPVVPEDETPVDEAEVVAGLPSLDDISAGFDMAPFLAKGVPAHLKNAALRKLWSASPAVRDYLDPAVDYAWDWNAPGGVPGGGGVLSEQSVAKMVKDLIGTRSEDIIDQQEEEVIASDEDPVDAIPDDAPVAVRPMTQLKREEEVPRVADASPLAPQRRHGGAVPE